MSECNGVEPDYRYTLANERTFLAYTRTALGLDAAGLALDQFFRPTGTHLRTALAAGVILLAIGVMGLGYTRWRQTERAMRIGAPLPAIRLPLILAGGIIVVSLTAIALLFLGR
jgi:putative membrane protein